MRFAICLLLFFTATVARADFALRDGDTVAFLGDSITAARGYTKIVEQYTLLRYPERHVRFVNAGIGGDTAWGGSQRLERDVFAKGATVVTVAFGINDIGWGAKGDAEHQQRYLDGIRSIVEQCKAHGVRPIICSAAITSVPPDEAETGLLQKMTEEGLALAKSLGAETVDLQRPMREAQRRALAANADEKDPEKKTQMHVKDGVHLSDLGQLAMAHALLLGLGAPAEVSAAALDAETGSVVESAHCTLSAIRKNADGLEFTRLDEGLPLNLGPFSVFNNRWVPYSETLNRYMLTVKGLPTGEYEIRVDDRLVGKTSAAQLEKGQNISSITANGFEPGGPWDAQSNVVKDLVDARDKLWNGGELRSRFLATQASAADLAARFRQLDDELVALQRAAAKPCAYHFVIRKLPPSSPTAGENGAGGKS